MRAIRHPFAGILIAAAVLLAAAPRVKAIVYGFVDTNNVFTNTGAFIVRSPSTGNIFPICSGALISPTVFLTALTSPATDLIPVTGVVSNPGYNQSQSDPGDIAVLLVNAGDTIGITPAVLPSANLLDRLAAQNGLRNVVFTPVGYGVQNRVVGGGTPFFLDANPVPRMYAFSTFNALNPAFLRLSQNTSTGDGGTCFGDSGGPNFFTYRGTQLLAAITITGDAVCRATNVVYRVDTVAARQFLAPFLTLP